MGGPVSSVGLSSMGCLPVSLVAFASVLGIENSSYIQGVSLGFDIMYLALVDRNMQVGFGLWWRRVRGRAHAKEAREHVKPSQSSADDPTTNIPEI